jgi:hypothetical protein
MDFQTFIFFEAINLFGDPILPEEVNWFHCTRTVKDNKFKEGILPLGEVIDEIWNMIEIILINPVHKHRLMNMKANGFKERLYYQTRFIGVLMHY